MVGEIHKSTYWGDMLVKEYKNSKNVTVEFVNTGNEVTTHKHNILKGLVQDVTERKRLMRESAEQRKEFKEKDTELAKEQRQNELSKYKAAVRHKKESIIRWYSIVRELRSNVDSEGKSFLCSKHDDRNGHTFTVVKKKSFNSKKWLVMYDQSGNKYWVSETSIASKSFHDKLCPFASEAEKFRVKLVNASRYESLREDIIARASEYQRVNLERTRVRNRNRRARRMNAEGTHTLEEVMLLLDQQGNKCKCCSIELTETTRELDHRMPLIRGGANSIENLQWLCQFCNGCKNASHPDEWEAYSKSDEFKKRRAERLLVSNAD